MKKYIIIGISIICTIAVILSFLWGAGYFEAKPDYTGFKEVQLTEKIKCKIPESWQAGYVNDVLTIYEEVENEIVIYLIHGTAELSIEHPNFTVFNHPIWGTVEWQESIDSTNNSITIFSHGYYKLENGDLEEMYIMHYGANEFFLLTYELADKETLNKIYLSIGSVP